MSKIKVLVVDDHTIVRDGICALLSLTPDIVVIGEAINGHEALDAVQKLVPDIVLMDLAMPVMGGLEATRRICKDSPQTKIIVLTQHDDRENVLPTIEAGARGFISKEAASSELTTAIRSVFHGDSYLSPSVTTLLLEDYKQTASTRREHDPYDQLTDRERETLKLLAEGHTTQEIARMLVLSPKTVERHKTGLMAKLDIHNRTTL